MYTGVQQYSNKMATYAASTEDFENAIADLPLLVGGVVSDGTNPLGSHPDAEIICLEPVSASATVQRCLVRKHDQLYWAYVL
jgi:hypothetical protein